MAQRRVHYDAAFEHYLRANQVPYVAVDEAKKALAGPRRLKSFDFVVYGSARGNLLVDVKGRKHSGRSNRQLDSWVTEADIADMLRWEQVFGSGFRATLVFLYWCAVQPPDALFQEIFTYRDRWYAIVAVDVQDYQRRMKVRSPKWKTVYVPAEPFGRISQPLAKLL